MTFGPAGTSHVNRGEIASASDAISSENDYCMGPTANWVEFASGNDANSSENEQGQGS